eukprot:6514671-Pyramimonas_sp.AAC.1
MAFDVPTYFSVDTRNGKPAARLMDAHCEAHRLQGRSSYPVDTLAATSILEGCYPTAGTQHEMRDR